MYREQTYRELLVADQRRRAAAARLTVIRTYFAVSFVCLIAYATITTFYNRRLSRSFVVAIDGVDVTVFEDYLSTLTSGAGGAWSYFLATFFWRFIPSAALIIGLASALFASYAYFYPNDKNLVTYFSTNDVKRIHDRSARLSDASDAVRAQNEKIYNDADLGKRSEERFKTKASSGATATGSPSQAGNNSLFAKALSSPTTNNVSLKSSTAAFIDSIFSRRTVVDTQNAADRNSAAINRSTISTQEDLNRFMDAARDGHRGDSQDDNANVGFGGTSGTNNEALLAILGTNNNSSSNRYGGANFFSDFNQQNQQRQANGIEVIFGLGKTTNTNANGKEGNDAGGAASSSNVAAIFGSDTAQAFSAAASNNFGTGNTQNRTPSGPQLTSKQLRMLQMWHSLNITDITVSTASARRWVCGILNDLVKDINRCNRELAARNMNELDCSHSLLMMHTAPTTTAAPVAAAPSATCGFGTAPPAATGFGGAATTTTGFGASTGGFGAPKPFGAATTTSTGFGAPTAGVVPTGAPLTKGQQLLNDKAVLNGKAPTADSMDLLELINLRLGLERALDVANSLMYRAVRSMDAVAPTPVAAAPAAGGFGTGGGFGATTGGFGKPATGFGAPATGAAGFGAPAASTAAATAATTAPKADASKKFNSPQERQLQRPYILHRLALLAAQRGLQAFDNDGGDINGWNESLPTDSHLILHILQMRCSNVFADAVKLAHAPVPSSEVQTAFRPTTASKTGTSTSRGAHPYIHVGSVGEPYFFVESPVSTGTSGLTNAHLFSQTGGAQSKLYLTMQTSDSLFEAIVLFAALMKRSKPSDSQLQDLGLYSFVV